MKGHANHKHVEAGITMELDSWGYYQADRLAAQRGRARSSRMTGADVDENFGKGGKSAKHEERKTPRATTTREERKA